MMRSELSLNNLFGNFFDLFNFFSFFDFFAEISDVVDNIIGCLVKSLLLNKLLVKNGSNNSDRNSNDIGS